MRELTDNVYNQRRRRDQPKVKLWRDAGLLLTYRCNCACEFCSYHCSPEKGGLMSVDMALRIWHSLESLAGDEARIHLTGGEVFLVWDSMIAILEEVKASGMMPANVIETNGYWARTADQTRDRVRHLDALGIVKLKVSCDAFHQAFVDIECVRRLVRIAEEELGPDRVLVRWRNYLDEGENLKGASIEKKLDRYLESIAGSPCRYTGRAAGMLAEQVATQSLPTLRGRHCKKSFYGENGIHIDPYGNVFSGTCSGIIMGNVNDQSLEEMWLSYEPTKAQMIETLFHEGPAGLLNGAETVGYQPLLAYADKCHLCTDLRQFLFKRGRMAGVVGPGDCYNTA